MAASPVPDLPLWAWNLVIAMQHHEDLHAKSDPCLNGVLNNVPADVRNQAAAISAYVQKASGHHLADKVTKSLSDILDSFFGDKTGQSQEQNTEAAS
ncbi:hypothetical protein ABZ438_08115 [Streptomyces sp. NPDC005786]|uniref:hypothetical protein n=1 Tax=Streptomyces sp. NPDC005786 TaxID=3154891 RepID=UPI0034075217